SGVIHSANGDFNILEKIINLGFFLSFNGISTFKNAGDIRDLISKTDIQYILVETDSPFLSPEPLRGTFPNKPSNIKYVIDLISKIKNNKDTENILYDNSTRLFRI
ncbi:TatD family hydrolase, partial [Patescibacteria group bacterium]|nr:TatD family hydrolase [Patescibacteria group bacterium]